MAIPDYISIGHITHDLVGNGITPGGPALYSACTARNLGVRTGMVSSFSRPLLHPELFQGITIQCEEAAHTTTFTNLYDDRGKRRQIIESIAEQITPELIPDSWRSAKIVNFCPVADEYTPEVVRVFDQALIGICPQGWMRKWDTEGHVKRKAWENFPEVLSYADFVFFSEEDVDDPDEAVAEYLRYAKMVIVTRGKQGASVFSSHQAYHVPAFQTIEVEPTGAGDVFATAFLIRYYEVGDPEDALTFANCVASFVVEKEGIHGIPSRDEAQQRLQQAAM